jgi:spermidine synthase
LLVVEPVAFWSLRFNLEMGTLLCSTILYFVPLALLAMTGPFVVRVITVAVAGVGGNVGRLTAVSTLGSFAGTVLIGYVLIPRFPNSFTLYGCAALLMLVVAGYFLGWERSTTARGAMVAGVLFGMVIGFLGVARSLRVEYPGAEEVYRSNSAFGLMQVLESTTDNRRLYLNDYLVQNTYDPFHRRSDSMFTYMLSGLAQTYTPRLDSALCIGLGIGIVPMDFANRGIEVDAVEINAAVVPLATNYFAFDPTRVDVTIGDGRYFLNQTSKRYDTVILDAFIGDSSPSHLMTREAFAAMKNVLNPGGTLVINSFGDFDPGRDFLTASLHKTLSAVFASVRIHAAGNGNTFYVASDRRPMEPVRTPELPDPSPRIRQQIEQAFARIRTVNPEHGMVLTDDYNPAEVYDAANRERMRRHLALSMRSR